MDYSSLVDHAARLKALEANYLHGLRELQALRTQVDLAIQVEQSKKGDKGMEIPSDFARPEASSVSFNPLKPLPHHVALCHVCSFYTARKTIYSFCFKLAKLISPVEAPEPESQSKLGWS
jgi:hypothetical protein